MAEYIEKLATIHAIKNYGIAAINENRRSMDIADDIIKLYDVIGNMPAADVVPVVRCRDCCKRGLPECPMETEYPWIDADSDGFCNQGVKKKGSEYNNID